MTDESVEVTNRESLEKLEKVLNLWKTKNIVTQFKTKKKADTSVVDDAVMLLGKKVSKKDIQPNSLEDITLTAQRLCEEYIEARLTRSGIKEFNYSTSTIEEEYSNVLQNMGQILEMKYPKLYSKISLHLKLSFDSEIVVLASFNKFGGHLFLEGITWAKILAFYAFTGGLALDCVSHKKDEFLGRIVYWFGMFVMKKLAPWIQQQGGWNAITDHFNKASEKQDFDDYSDDDEQDENSRLQKIKTRIKELVADQENQKRLIIISVLIVLVSYVSLLCV